VGKQRAAFQMASRAVMTRDPRTLADALPLWQVRDPAGVCGPVVKVYLSGSLDR